MYRTNDIIGHNTDVTNHFLFGEEEEDGKFFESVSFSHPGTIITNQLFIFIGFITFL